MDQVNVWYYLQQRNKWIRKYDFKIVREVNGRMYMVVFHEGNAPRSFVEDPAIHLVKTNFNDIGIPCVEWLVLDNPELLRYDCCCFSLHQFSSNRLTPVL